MIKKKLACHLATTTFYLAKSRQEGGLNTGVLPVLPLVVAL